MTNKITIGLICLFFITAIFCNTPAISWDNGTYLGCADGYVDNVRVKVDVRDNKIANVTILSHRESLPSSSLTQIPDRIVKAQSIDVHAVTGATITSDAIMRAVKNALENKSGPDSEKVLNKNNKKSDDKALKEKMLKLSLKNKVIKLPEPSLKGIGLMQALLKRCSTRTFDRRDLDMETISGLLWAANGVNRPDKDLRTAPSARNWQEIDIYIALKKGLYKYDHKSHSLIQRIKGDMREKIAIQPFVKTAPAVLLYVRDKRRMSGCADREIDFYTGADTGYISQNVYLYCASKSLATVVVAMLHKKALASMLSLTRHENLVLAQPVGYPIDNSVKSRELKK